jgi:hypothetical protein
MVMCAPILDALGLPAAFILKFPHVSEILNKKIREETGFKEKRRSK